MESEAEPQKRAEKIAEKVEKVLKESKKGLVYSTKVRARKENSLNTMFLQVTLFNIENIESILEPSDWKQLKELGFSFEINKEIDPPYIYFKKSFGG